MGVQFRCMFFACLRCKVFRLPTHPWIRNNVAIAFLCLASYFHALGPTSQAEAQEIAGRYKLTGASIRYQIAVPQQKPAAVIIIQYLPPHTAIQNAIPAYDTYDPQTGIVKWLLSEVEPGVLTIRLQMASPVDQHAIKAEVLFKDHSGASNTFAIEPLPMKRTQLEGC